MLSVPSAIYFCSPSDVTPNCRKSSFDDVTNYKLTRFWQLNPQISPPCSHCLQLRVPWSFSTSSTLPFLQSKFYISWHFNETKHTHPCKCWWLTCVARISISPDPRTEQCGSGTRSPEWEPHNTADLMIGTCTGSHHHQQGTTVQQCFKLVHVRNNCEHHPLWMNNSLAMVCKWNTHYLAIGQDKDQMWAVCGAWHTPCIILSVLEKAPYMRALNMP